MKKKEHKYNWYRDGVLMSDEEVEAEITWFQDILEKRKDKKDEIK